LLQVSRSGYYAWRIRPESRRARRDRELTELIRQIHVDSDGVYGAAKITAELNERGYPCGRHKVARLMRLAGLKGCPKTSFKVTTQRDPKHAVAGNLLQQDFTAKAMNQRWASDITYIKTRQGWLYLAVVLDLGRCTGPVLAPSRRLVDEPLDQSAPGDQRVEHGD
jgi:transposase InsO family protein